MDKKTMDKNWGKDGQPLPQYMALTHGPDASPRYTAGRMADASPRQMA